MKSSILIVLAFLLAMAILAPSIITICGVDGNPALVMELNEKENKKEEKKEVNEKDFFFFLHFNTLTSEDYNKSMVSNFYRETDYGHSREILLPPPEHIV